MKNYNQDYKSTFKILSHGRVSLAVSALLASTLSWSAPVSNALPTGGSVANGSASISTTANKMTINQTTNKSIINWNSFNIGSSAEVRYNLPNSSSSSLNRVTSNNPSQIYGKLSSNGNILLVNPSGIIFGASSSVDVGSLVATTMNIKDQDYLNDNYSFSRDNTTGTITNYGTLSASDKGYIALLSPTVINEGVVRARLGTVVMAAGERATLNFDGTGLVSVTLDPSTINTLIDNKQMVVAEGGKVFLSAKSASMLLARVVNSGVMDASSMSDKGGRIVLESDTIVNSGSLLARGKSGGGEILVGGDWQGSNADKVSHATTTILTGTSIIDASATDSGNGGKIVVWSGLDKANGMTVANGSLKAEGGVNGGDGGKIETSGHNLQVAEATQVSAQSYNGKSGSWLLDPVDIVICHTGNCGGADATYTIDSSTLSNAAYYYKLYSEGNAATSYISDSTINTALNASNTSVDIMTVSTTGGGNGDITVKGDVVIVGNNRSTSGSATNYPRRFGLLADRNIIFESGAKITAGTAGTAATVYNQSLAVYLKAGYSSTGYDVSLGGTTGTDGGMSSPTDNGAGYIYMDGATILTNGGRFQAYASTGDATHASVTIKNSTIDTNNLTSGTYYGGGIDITGGQNAAAGGGVLIQNSTLSAKTTSGGGSTIGINGQAGSGSTGDGVTIDNSTLEAFKGGINFDGYAYNPTASGNTNVGLRIKGNSILSAKSLTLNGTSYDAGNDNSGGGKTGVSLEYGSINMARVSGSEVLDTTITVTDHSKYGVNFGDSSNHTFTIGNTTDNAQITFAIKGGKNNADSTVMTTTGTAPVAFVGNGAAYPTSGTNKNYLLFKPAYEQGGAMTYIGGSSVPGGAPNNSILFSAANLSTLNSAITGIKTFGIYTANSALNYTVQSFDMHSIPYVFVGSLGGGNAISITLASGAPIVRSTQTVFVNPDGVFTDDGAVFSGSGYYFLLSQNLSKYTGTSAVTPLTSSDAFSTYSFDGTNLRVGGSTVPSTQNAFLCTAGTCSTYVYTPPAPAPTPSSTPTTTSTPTTSTPATVPSTTTNTPVVNKEVQKTIDNIIANLPKAPTPTTTSRMPNVPFAPSGAPTAGNPTSGSPLGGGNEVKLATFKPSEAPKGSDTNTPTTSNLAVGGTSTSGAPVVQNTPNNPNAPLGTPSMVPSTGFETIALMAMAPVKGADPKMVTLIRNDAVITLDAPASTTTTAKSTTTKDGDKKEKDAEGLATISARVDNAKSSTFVIPPSVTKGAGVADNSQVVQVNMKSGAPLPEWIKVDPVSMAVQIKNAPANAMANGGAEIKLTIKEPNNAIKTLIIKINETAGVKVASN